MKNTKLILILASLVFLFPVGGFGKMTEREAISKFVSAGMAYKNEEYEDAIEKYLLIIDGGMESGAVYYNLGNSYYRKGDLGEAVLNYERAKRLMPRDSDLQFNSRYVSSRIDQHDNLNKTNFLNRAVRSFADFYTTGEMVMVVVGAIGILGIMFLLSLYLQWPKSWARGIMIFLAMIALIYTIGIAVKVQLTRDRAVILMPSESYFEPRKDSTVHFKLSEGEKARMIRSEADWTKIERLDGKTGWVSSKILGKI
ncbi:MAG: tetratricopeptide repeat protein [Candidatus Omnitrophica bacterium]|nr:tetratricopeptide repeat protein [Candidatus Omnitrophota bacterium]